METKEAKEGLKEIFWGVLIIFILALLGILNQWIISGNSILFRNTVFYHLVGFTGLVLLTIFLDYRKIPILIIWSFYLFLIFIFLVLCVFKKRWLNLGFINFQPSEFLKPTLVWLISAIASKEASLYIETKALIKILMIIIIPLILILPTDLDYVFIMTVMFGSFLIFIGIPRKIIITLALLGLIIVLLVFPVVWGKLKPYQKGRIYGYLDVEKYAQTWGYQLNQALIAIGSGGLWGHGFKKGWSTRLDYLPAKHTDLAFAVWAETWGFIGVTLFLLLYGYLLYFCLKISYTAKDWLGKYLSLGTALVLFWQSVFNIGGCLGLLPMTSIPLPFLSYGGSITISVYILLYLTFNVALKRYFFK